MPRFVVLFALVVLIFNFAVEVQGECNCINLRSCRHVLDLVTDKRTPPEVKQKLKSLHCGFDGRMPKVCCPEETNGSQSENLLPGRNQCGIEFGDRIFGGEECSIFEFPWMAMLSYSKSNGKSAFLCGGTLINDRYVLTAGHCVKTKKEYPKLIGVRLGEHNTEEAIDCETEKVTKETFCNTGPFDSEIEEVIPHEQYNPSDKNQYNDIALLRLKKKVTYSDFIRPICLPNSITAERLIDLSLTAAGWGVTENKNNSNVKLKVRVPVKDNSNCNDIYRVSGVRITGNQVCAGGTKSMDTCNGDSGGPLMKQGLQDGIVNWEIAGVVSYGPLPCGQENKPGVYTRVDKYMDWIVSKLKP